MSDSKNSANDVSVGLDSVAAKSLGAVDRAGAAPYVVLVGRLRLDYPSTGFAMMSITYSVADNPNFNPAVGNWFSWTGHGSDTAVKPPIGQPSHIEIMASWSEMALVPGTTYYAHAVVLYNVNGGAQQIATTPVITFTA